MAKYSPRMICKISQINIFQAKIVEKIIHTSYSITFIVFKIRVVNLPELCSVHIFPKFVHQFQNGFKNAI
jgi:hypothetical protein